MGLRARADKLTRIADSDWTVSIAERPTAFRTGQVAGLTLLAAAAIAFPLGPSKYAVATTILAVAVCSGLLEKRVPDRNLDGVLQLVFTAGALICATLMPSVVVLTAISIVGTTAAGAIFQGRRAYFTFVLAAGWLGSIAYLNDTPLWYLLPLTILGTSTTIVEFADWFRIRERLQRQRMKLLTEVGGAFTWEAELETNVLLQTKGPTQKVLGRTEAELLSFLNDEVAADSSRSLADQRSSVREIPHADGSARWFKLKRETRRRPDGVKIAYGVAVDVTEIELARRREQQRAEVDSLTGLANRNGLAKFLDAESDRLGRAMLVVDLDRFKEINDTLGHLVGDSLITKAARRLANLTDERCFIARLGGDEFAFAVVGDDAEKVDKEAESLAIETCNVIRQSFAVDDLELSTSASVGIASGAGLDWTELLRRADGAMYQAKSTGSGHCWYDQKLDGDSSLKLERRSRLNHRLEDEIVLYYQPVVNAGDESLMFVEALARWHHPDEGVLSPAAFLPLLDHSGLTTRFDRHVLQQAVECASTMATLSERGIEVSVNLSPSSLRSPQLAGELKELLRKNPLAQGLLSIEVTEQGLFEDPERLAPMLNSVKELGIGLSLDDFGTGVSSLIRLRSLPFDTIKIDRSFVAGIPHNHTDTVIVASTIELARSLGKRTVAEGVETKDQIDKLMSMECCALQGWAFDKAMPFEELVAKYFPVNTKTDSGATIS